MRILYLCNDPGIDVAGKSGAAIHIRSFACALTELGHEVAIVACSLSDCRQTLEEGLHTIIWRAPLSAWNRALAQVLRASNRTIGRTPRIRACSIPAWTAHWCGNVLTLRGALSSALSVRSNVGMAWICFSPRFGSCTGPILRSTCSLLERGHCGWN